MKVWGSVLTVTGLLMATWVFAASQTTVITQGNPVVLPGNHANAGAVSGNTQAGNATSTMGATNTEVVVPVPPQVVWGNGAATTTHESQPHCMSCCIYQNRNYSEGAVIKAEGVLLQCQRDKTNLGTNNLLWRILREGQ